MKCTQFSWEKSAGAFFKNMFLKRPPGSISVVIVYVVVKDVVFSLVRIRFHLESV